MDPQTEPNRASVARVSNPCEVSTGPGASGPAEHSARLTKPCHRKVGLAIFIASLLPWLIRNDVAKLIAMQRDVLLGRYALGWFCVLLVMTIVAWGVAWNVAFPSKLSKRQRQFRAITALLVTLITLGIVDSVWRIVRKPRYVEQSVRELNRWPMEGYDGKVRRRPPNQVYQITRTDEPQIARRYPIDAPGFGTIKVTFTTDARGFRNVDKIDRCEILALGDSFTEGSKVNDDEPWPAVLTKLSGRSTYNLGMAGTSPAYYCNALKGYGLELSPKIVICTIYSGNDFRGDAPAVQQAGFGDGIGKYIRTSPIRLALQRTMAEQLGRINSTGPVSDGEALSWIPMAAPHAPGAPQYAFTPKQLLSLNLTRDELLKTGGWRAVSSAVMELSRICKQNQIRLIIVYAPTKYQVTMPLVKDAIPAGPLRKFCSYARANLPEAAAFKEQLFARLDVQENALLEFCRGQGIEAISPAAALRAKASAGVQVYYTYDQHWTAAGQAVVAEEIHRYLSAGKRSE